MQDFEHHHVPEHRHRSVWAQSYSLHVTPPNHHSLSSLESAPVHPRLSQHHCCISPVGSCSWDHFTNCLNSWDPEINTNDAQFSGFPRIPVFVIMSVFANHSSTLADLDFLHYLENKMCFNPLRCVCTFVHSYLPLCAVTISCSLVSRGDK